MRDAAEWATARRTWDLSPSVEALPANPRVAPHAGPAVVSGDSPANVGRQSLGGSAARSPTQLGVRRFRRLPMRPQPSVPRTGEFPHRNDLAPAVVRRSNRLVACLGFDAGLRLCRASARRTWDVSPSVEAPPANPRVAPHAGLRLCREKTWKPGARGGCLRVVRARHGYTSQLTLAVRRATAGRSPYRRAPRMGRRRKRRTPGGCGLAYSEPSFFLRPDCLVFDPRGRLFAICLPIALFIPQPRGEVLDLLHQDDVVRPANRPEN